MLAARGNAISSGMWTGSKIYSFEVLRGDSVESASRVWSGNERDQELLLPKMLWMIHSFILLTGQQTPAFGRRVSDVIEIADAAAVAVKPQS